MRKGDSKKRIAFVGLVFLLAGFASAGTVADLEQMQATHANVLYQYTFEGTDDAQRLEQKVGTFEPDLQGYSNGANTVTFPDGYDTSTKVKHSTSGAIWGDGFRHYGSGVKTESYLEYPTSGTIEYMVKCSDIGDQGYVIAGTGWGSEARMRFFQNDNTNYWGSKALMTIGENSPVDLLGGISGLAYTSNVWYYIVQTWDIDTVATSANATLNAWAAKMSGIPTLTKTVNNVVKNYDGTPNVEAFFGSLSVATPLDPTNAVNGYFSNSDLDAVAIYSGEMDAATVAARFYALTPKPDVAALESSQAAHPDLAHHYTFEGTYNPTNGTGTWLDNKAAATPDLVQTLFESHRIADQVAGYDGTTSSADFLAWASGGKGDGLNSDGAITFATNGTIEYLVKFGPIANLNIMLAGKATGAQARLYFLTVDGTKAYMTMGANNPEDLIGGSTGVGYAHEEWYYVAQTWSIDAGASNITMDAWVANLNDAAPTLVKTVDGAVNTYIGDTTTQLDMGSLLGLANWFTDGGLDAVAIYDAQLGEATLQSHLEDVLPGGGVIPADIVGWSPMPGNVVRMVVDAPGAGEAYYPIHVSGLTSGTWEGVEHSTNGSPPFVATNLEYVSEFDASGTNEVIYVLSTNAAGFFGIGGE